MDWLLMLLMFVSADGGYIGSDLYQIEFETQAHCEKVAKEYALRILENKPNSIVFEPHCVQVRGKIVPTKTVKELYDLK